MCKVELKALKFSRGALEILDIPSLQLASGSQTLLTGGSGCGKSTLIHLLAGFLKADSGSYLLGGKAHDGLSEREWDQVRARRIGVVFQNYPMLRGFSLLDNVLIPMGFSKSLDRDYALKLLSRVGLGERTHHRPSQLSAGQRQRAAIVRAVINRPDFILADEPTAHLDPESGEEALKLMKEFAVDTGATLLVVSHDHRLLDDFQNHLSLNELNLAAKSS